MKILNLVLYNETEAYKVMHKAHSTFCSVFDNVDTFYLTSNPDQTENVRVDGNFISVQGSESIVPGLLQKTISAAIALKDKIKNYDFVLRTNISTLVNFRLLKKLQISPDTSHYFGAKVLSLGWLDIPSGIVDYKYFGTTFVTGSCVFFSNNTFRRILDSVYHLDYSIIDDVAIGILVRDHLTDISPMQFPNHMVFGYEGEDNFNNFLGEGKTSSMLAIRFKSTNRMQDALSLQDTASLLGNVYYD
jgi:hypothetical protein